MQISTSPIIDPKDVSTLKGEIVIVDARSGPDALQRYESGHYPNAIHVDLDKDLSKKETDAARGGRHPLPPLADFGKTLGRLGIKQSSTVVVYDDKNGANAAARLWWMLRAIGHQSVYVIDGGLDAIARNIPLQKGIIQPKAVEPYPITDWLLPLATISEVEKAAESPDQVVVDVRESFRYRGEKEPIDLIAGHIPGAINFPYVDNLNADGTFKDPTLLKSLYENALDGVNPERVIVHCGSGVTACHTLLALAHAGLLNSKLYVGSWSEWSRNNKPIAKGEH